MSRPFERLQKKVNLVNGEGVRSWTKAAGGWLEPPPKVDGKLVRISFLGKPVTWGSPLWNPKRKFTPNIKKRSQKLLHRLWLQVTSVILAHPRPSHRGRGAREKTQSLTPKKLAPLGHNADTCSEQGGQVVTAGMGGTAWKEGRTNKHHRGENHF